MFDFPAYMHNMWHQMTPAYDNLPPVWFKLDRFSQNLLYICFGCEIFNFMHKSIYRFWGVVGLLFQEVLDTFDTLLTKGNCLFFLFEASLANIYRMILWYPQKYTKLRLDISLKWASPSIYLFCVQNSFFFGVAKHLLDVFGSCLFSP